MSMFCNVMMLLLLYVHVCVTRTGWKTRPRPKTVILSIKKSNNQSVSLFLPPPAPLSLSSLSLSLSTLAKNFVVAIYVHDFLCTRIQFFIFQNKFKAGLDFTSVAVLNSTTFNLRHSATYFPHLKKTIFPPIRFCFLHHN